MGLPDVLLSLLREPMSGSDLIRLFRSTINHFWHTDLSQIYRALDSLQRQGCLSSRSVPSPQGPARKVYRLTAKGRARLSEWVRTAPPVPAVKLEYLAKLFSVTGEAAPRERARELLEGMREEAMRSLKVLERIDLAARDAPGYPDAMPAHIFYPWLTLRHGLLRRRALVEWLDESLARLERRPGDVDAEIPEEVLSAMLAQWDLASDRVSDDDPEARDEDSGEG